MQGCAEPQINRWYTGLRGRLFRVKTYSLNDSGIHSVVLQYVDGETQVINRHEWFCLQNILNNRT